MISSRTPHTTRGSRWALTLVELLVVIAIIAILVYLLLPAINAAREAARRNGCMSNLGQLGVALSSYHLAHEVYPPGSVDAAGPAANIRQGYHHSWLVQLLPYVDEQLTYQNIDKSQSVYHANNTPVAQVVTMPAGDGPLYVGGFGSEHMQGALFLMGDGHVRFLPDAIDMNIYGQLGHRADGKLLGSLDEL